ncbi:type IX secretion system outer membrane channel protein PorV [Rhodothermus bifroesti]|nr:type IX secretion system outer membrane channel protein PorV [Rhodothermus bifroesti]
MRMMSKMVHVLHTTRGLLLTLAGCCLAVAAQAQVGGAAVLFLQIEPDSRAAGMGNAGVAVADNAYALFWNPAGLAFQPQAVEVSITHSNWLPEFNAGLYYEYLVGRFSLGRWGNMGAHVTLLNMGEHEWRDENNNPLGTFRSYDVAAGLSYGYQIHDRLALGVGLRYIYSNLASGIEVEGRETKAGKSFGLDIGLLYRTRPFSLGGQASGQFSAGFNLNNMGPQIQYSDGAQKDPIPTNIRFGYAFTFDLDPYNRITFANDFTKLLIRVRSDSTGSRADPFYKAIFTAWRPIQVRENPYNEQEARYRTLSVWEQLMIGLGVEYWYNQLFALRTGFFYENPYNGNRQFMTFGAGLRYNIVGVDFSYVYALKENHPLANTMRFSLLLNFKK